MQSITSPGRVEGLKSAAISRSLGNRGYGEHGFTFVTAKTALPQNRERQFFLKIKKTNKHLKIKMHTS